MGKRDPILPEKKPVECRFEQRKGGYCYCRKCHLRIKGKQAKKHRLQQGRLNSAKIKTTSDKPSQNSAPLNIKGGQQIQQVAIVLRLAFPDRIIFRCYHEDCRVQGKLTPEEASRLLSGKKYVHTICASCKRQVVTQLDHW